MNQSREDVGSIFVTNDNPTKPLQPSIGALHDPTSTIPSQLATILMCGAPIVAPRRDDRFDAARDQQQPQGVAVVGSIRNQPAQAAAPASAIAGRQRALQ